MTQRFLSAASLLTIVSSTTVTPTEGNVIINEIADKGSSDVCNGDDWIELYNAGIEPVDLSAKNYVLHDDKGLRSADTFVFPPETMLGAQDYLLLCTNQNVATDEDGINMVDPMSPQFGISGDDTISLTRVQVVGNATLGPSISVSTGRNGDIYEVMSVVSLPNTDDNFDVSYAYDFNTGTYGYTSTPTPGAPNVITKLMTQEEKNAEFKAKLIAQNDEGIKFFNMDNGGLPVEGGMEDVLDLSFTMLEADYANLTVNMTHELYQQFQSAVLSNTDGTELLTMSQPGKIRSKGQSSLFMSACLGTDTFPFQVQWGGDETLFGVETIFLRNHIGDYSFMRDWAYNRMLARFGLPFVRTRKARVYINGNLHGFYSLMEAPDQDYVFARSFPDFDPEAYALYKIKSAAFDCGSYTTEEIETAEERLHETSTPPYAFQRGGHKPMVEKLGLMGFEECIENYDKDLWERDYYDIVLAWLRYDRSCEDMLLKEKLIDQDLGTKSYKKEMKEFITQDYSQEQKCDEQCQNTDLSQRVDVQNWLKTFAFYAVTMNSDSPLINGNNFYMSMTGAENYGGVGGWKLVAYDFNLPTVLYCHDDLCDSRMVHWSIARPTCTSMEQNNLVGPLLSDEKFHAQYLEYVRQFTEEVYGNEAFVAQLKEHAAAQKKYVMPDFWSFFGAFYGKELTPESANWEEEDTRFPLLPTMKARTEDVRAQLAAIDEGSFPRGPFVGVHGDNEAWEPCADWRLTEPNQTACPGGCDYHGCDEGDWVVSSFCDEEKGVCVYGDYDAKCEGIYDDFQYLGMEEKTWCRYTKGLPVKAMECPARGAASGAAPPESTSGGSSVGRGLSLFGAVLFGLVGAFCW